jgi:tRNA dimethylallyltransferase
MQTYGEPVFPVSIVGISLPKDVLDRRIDERLAAMRDAGFVDEVRALARSGALSRTARQAIGYQELLAYVDGSEPSLDAAFEEAARRTKRFARRQLRWFRRDPRITWLPAEHNPCEVVPSLLALWSR